MSRFAKRPVLIVEAPRAYFGSALRLFQKRTVFNKYARASPMCISQMRNVRWGVFGTGMACAVVKRQVLQGRWMLFHPKNFEAWRKNLIFAH